MTHLVKSHHIINGLLEIENHFHDDLESALKFIESEIADYFKVFDQDGVLVHSTEPVENVQELTPVSTEQVETLTTNNIQVLTTSDVQSLTTEQIQVLVPVTLTAIVNPAANTTV